MRFVLPFVPAIAAVALIVAAQWGVVDGPHAFDWTWLVLLWGGVLTLVGAGFLWLRKAVGPALWWGVAASILLGFVGAIAWQSRIFPEINDYTSDFENPPMFQAIAALPENQGRVYDYPSANTDLIRQAFPQDLHVMTDRKSEEAFDAALEIVRESGWRVLAEDRENGLIEAVVTSRLYRLQDDFAIRVSAMTEGARVDFRSKSRGEGSDLGSNPLRMMRFKRTLEKSLQAE